MRKEGRKTKKKKGGREEGGESTDVHVYACMCMHVYMRTDHLRAAHVGTRMRTTVLQL